MIHWHIHEYLIKKEAGFIQKGDRVIELGEQYIDIDQFNQHTEENPLLSPDFYQGIETISIDLTPQYHAIKLDLSKNISTKQRPEPGDVVTDFGTLEHVVPKKKKDFSPEKLSEYLYWGLKNTFNLLKIGGYGMHVNPLSGGYLKDHGFHYFTEDFWRAFCGAAKLDIKMIDIKAAYHNHETGNELYCVYQKTDKSKFPTKQAFDKIYKSYIKAE